MKKFLSLVLALVMTMSLVTVSAGAKDFTDNDAITYEEAVAVMSEIGVIDGYTTGDFKPTATLTRGAAAKIICNLILGPTTANALAATTAPFSDVAADSTFAGYIAYLSKEGIIGGYADGTFKPGNSLTGYAFLKMLLGALGYDAAIEGYNGANYAVSVAKQAIEAGLTAGLVDEFDGRTAVTREEACLYAFNTLKAIMVEYDNRIVVGEGATAVAISGVRKDLTWNKGTKNDGNIEDDGFVQFAEQYFPKLKMVDDTDAFERPAHTWTYDNDTIGTYVDWTEMVAEYTSKVTGKELYGVIGKSAFDKYDFSAYVDGTSDDLYKQIGKDNKNDVESDEIYNGALTQVFVDNDNKEVVITVIHTYLAKATADYNSKKDTATYEVYGVSGNKTVSGEDFDVADVEKGDFALVTYSNATKAIESIDDVEILSDVKISTFSTNGKATSLTVDGTKYSDSTKLIYDEKVLDKYVNSNLKDTTYNVYLDNYGYVIGVDIVETSDNYVFITGADAASSNLATATWSANAIFLDGTSEVITVKNNDAIKDKALINSWFTYTVSSKGVYTLTEVESALDADNDVDVAQHHTSVSKVDTIDSKHIWLNGAAADGKIYGDDDTIYMIADMDTVKTDSNKQKVYGVIKGVEERVVGVDNVSIEVWGKSYAAQKLSTDKVTVTDSVGGAFALYDDDGRIIAVVVVGEGSSVSNSIALTLKSGITSESFDEETGLWTWTTDVVINGEKVTLTEVNDENDSEIKDKNTAKYVWFNVKYDANGNVKALEPLTAASTVAKYTTSFEAAAAQVEADEDLIVLDAADVTSYNISGKTLYETTAKVSGLRVAEDVNIVFIQTVNNKETTSYETGVTTLKGILDDLNDQPGVSYNFDAVLENGRITSVVVKDLTEDHAYDGATGTGAAKGVISGTYTANVSTAAGIKAQKDGAYSFKATDSMTIEGWDMGGTLDNYIFFKFKTADEKQAAALTIENAKGVVYEEAAVFADAGAHFFYACVAPYTCGTLTAEDWAAGNYAWSIISDGEVLASGSFKLS